MVMDYSQANVQGQQLVSSKDRVETNGQTDGKTDGGDWITSLANAVIKYSPSQATLTHHHSPYPL